ncbi:hypothetical protein [Arthrobacter sp. AZCC_0090]|uniref:hypothetical protein n=1 Tax=Arthrobacter sp. AZCC_0090 TaxID=2735881 RepID=UPI00161A5BB9|nr:hypothetical protein [Arthrobacter sp. AZCC_0090]MBB6405965.1 hypothetical protein [Arthrobacter sp. AZCC_0090]
MGQDDVQGAATDLANKGCMFANGAWDFTGTLSNSQKGAQFYSVRVWVRDTKTSSVVASQVLEEKLDPGKSVKLDRKALVKTNDAKGLDCVVDVIRKTA